MFFFNRENEPDLGDEVWGQRYSEDADNTCCDSQYYENSNEVGTSGWG